MRSHRRADVLAQAGATRPPAALARPGLALLARILSGVATYAGLAGDSAPPSARRRSSLLVLDLVMLSCWRPSSPGNWSPLWLDRRRGLGGLAPAHAPGAVVQRLHHDADHRDLDSSRSCSSIFGIDKISRSTCGGMAVKSSVHRRRLTREEQQEGVIANSTAGSGG